MHRYATTKTVRYERSIDELIDEFNAKAKAEGRYDGRAFWEVSPKPGSILDIPETPESRERIVWLRKRIAELKGEAEKECAPVQDIQQETGDAVQAQLPNKEIPAG